MGCIAVRQGILKARALPLDQYAPRIASTLRDSQLDTDHTQILEALEVALGLTENIEAAYRSAGRETRRLFNQAIFDRIWIDIEEVADVELASPMKEILEVDGALHPHRPGGCSVAADHSPSARRPRGCTGDQPAARNERTPRPVESRGGSNFYGAIERRTFEPSSRLKDGGGS